MTELCTDGYHVNTNVQEAAAGFFAFLRGGVGQAIIAAGQAVEAIARNVKKWQPSYQPKVEGDSPPPDPSDNLLAFDSFNIRQVLCFVFSILKVNPLSKYFCVASVRLQIEDTLCLHSGVMFM